MRTIKFRAWDSIDKQMNNKPVFLYEEDRISFTMEQESEYSFEIKRYAKSFVWMQFTGLLDKNGKEIYEGDIIHSDTYNENYSISFENGCFIYNIDEGEYSYLFEFMASNIKVIGNIYENPELLEVHNV